MKKKTDGPVGDSKPPPPPPLIKSPTVLPSKENFFLGGQLSTTNPSFWKKNSFVFGEKRNAHFSISLRCVHNHLSSNVERVLEAGKATLLAGKNSVGAHRGPSTKVQRRKPQKLRRERNVCASLAWRGRRDREDQNPVQNLALKNAHKQQVGMETTVMWEELVGCQLRPGVSCRWRGLARWGNERAGGAGEPVIAPGRGGG